MVTNWALSTVIRHYVCQTDFPHAIYAIILLSLFHSTLDYDRTVDHTYNFTVIATDNGQPPNNGSATVRVTVTNVNDEDPVFMQPVEHVQVSEDATTNTVVHVVQAYDPDGDDVTYSFLGELIVTAALREKVLNVLSRCHIPKEGWVWPCPSFFWYDTDSPPPQKI